MIRAGLRPLLIIAGIWTVSTLLWLTPGLTKPDGAGYFVYLPSTYFDRDLLFFDEWQQLGMIPRGRILHKEITATDHLGNHWTVGSALFWFPSFVLGDLVRAIPMLRSFPRNGFSLPYNVPVAFASAVAGLITLLVGYRTACRFAAPHAAALAAVAVWFGTPLIWYSLRQAILSHAVAAMSCALAFATAVWLRERSELTAWIVAGFAGGFAFAVRPQNAPVVLLPFFFAAVFRTRHLAAYGTAALAAAAPQLIVSSYIYGNPLAFLWGAGARPFAAFDRVWWWEPLLSWYHGLIPWTPLTALSLIGVALLWRTDRRAAAACAVFFVTQWFVNAALERSFWGASSFGQRRFDGCTIVFFIGAAVFFASIPRWSAVLLAVVCCAWTMSIFLAASAGLDLSAYYTPGELLRAQIAAVADAGAHLRFLSSVPPNAKAAVALLIAMSALFWSALLLLRWRRVASIAPGVVAAYLALMIVWFASSGSTRNLPRYAKLIAENRFVATLPGGADLRTGLLADELRYLRKAGREKLARDTEAELRALIAARAAAERRAAGKEPPQ